MAKATFWAILGLGLLGALISGYLRYELAFPGVSGLTIALAGDKPGDLYRLADLLHGCLSTMITFLVGAFAGFVAAERGFAPGRVCGWIAVVALAQPVWWLSGSLVQPGLDEIFRLEVFGAIRMQDGGLSHLVFLLRGSAIAVLLSLLLPAVGAAALLAGPGWRLAVYWAMVFTVPTVLCLSLVVALNQGGVPIWCVPAIVLAVLAPLVIAATGQTPRPDGLPYLWVVALIVAALVVQGFIASRTAADPRLQDTYFVVAQTHYQTGLIGLFVWFSALVRWVQLRIPKRWIWGHAGVMALCLLAVNVPMTLLGLQGMPRRFGDYAQGFAFWNLVSSIGALGLLLSVLTGLIVIRAASVRR